MTTYDDEAVRVAAAKAGLDEASVLAILGARDQYWVGIRRAPEAAARRLHARHPKLFPAEMVNSRTVDPGLERRFIALETGLTAAQVREALDNYSEQTRPQALAGAQKILDMLREKPKGGG